MTTIGFAMEWHFIYRGLKARYRDQRAELKALLAALDPADVVVDIGAHKGSYLWSLSRAVPQGRAVAFEPQPQLADYLLRACRAAGLNNVVVEAAGVSDRSGVLKLAIPGEGAHSPGASFEAAVREREACRIIEVPTASLDEYFSDEASKIGAIKIDVEGHELRVLHGAAGVIDAHRPTILCECEERHAGEDHVAAVVDFMAGRNYRGFFVERSKLRPVAEFDLRIHQKQEGDRFWDAPGYCNNFLFKPGP